MRAAMRGGYYHTGDVATSDDDGYITYVGRTDDVFKASDYRISPFELESVLIEHEAVAEAAVVPSPDPVRLAVPKAYVLLAGGRVPSPELAQSIMAFCRERVAPYKRIRRVEFGDLPKTISGKIRRVELRGLETSRPASVARRYGVLGGRLHLVRRGRGRVRLCLNGSPRPGRTVRSVHARRSVSAVRTWLRLYGSAAAPRLPPRAWPASYEIRSMR